jgi:hypothetical protein
MGDVTNTADIIRRRVFPVMRRYFRLELAGEVDELPDLSSEPCVFVMNHTAILGLEVYLLAAALDDRNPGAPLPLATVWPRFLEMPGLGAFYRAVGCIPMSVEGAATALRAGNSVLILPEGPDATDVRDAVGPFHTGFLRVVRTLAEEGRNVRVVPLGWAGVDEANPWWVTTNPTLVRILMKPFMPRFDFALIPRLPMLRPSKVVFVAGAPLSLASDELEDQAALVSTAGRIRSRVVELAHEAAEMRREHIEARPVERLLHRVTGTDRIAWSRR